MTKTAANLAGLMGEQQRVEALLAAGKHVEALRCGPSNCLCLLPRRWRGCRGAAARRCRRPASTTRQSDALVHAHPGRDQHMQKEGHHTQIGWPHTGGTPHTNWQAPCCPSRRQSGTISHRHQGCCGTSAACSSCCCQQRPCSCPAGCCMGQLSWPWDGDARPAWGRCIWLAHAYCWRFSRCAFIASSLTTMHNSSPSINH